MPSRRISFMQHAGATAAEVLRTARDGSAKDRYLAAWRWRRSVEQALRPLHVTFTQWLCLSAAFELTEERGDAVSQLEIARRAELDPATTSQVIGTLSRRDLVNRGPDMVWPAYRIIVTEQGERVVHAARASLAAFER